MTEKYDCTDEFREFLETAEVTPPLNLSQRILAGVRQDLSPTPFRVFAKLVGIVGIAGALSLFLCPQFGVSFMRHSGLHMFFYSYLGGYGCSIACGAFFSISGIIAAVLILRPEEFRVLKANEALLLVALSALSLGVLVCLGKTVFIEGALLWLFGSLAGAFVTTEIAATLILSRARL